MIYKLEVHTLQYVIKMFFHNQLPFQTFQNNNS